MNIVKRHLSFVVHYVPFRRQGQTALSLTFLIGTIILFAGVAIALVVMSFLNATYGYQAATRAYAAASGGVQDGLLQLIRNKTFSSPGGYSVPLNSYSASVTVNQNTPITGQVTIVSAATVSNYTRRIQAIASVSTSTGQVDLLLWQSI